LALVRFVLPAEYVFHPQQLWRRLLRRHLLRTDRVRLAWGLPIRITERASVGIDIMNHGVSDRIVPEAICRLLEPDEVSIDVGAHLGQNASIMALAAPRGTVTAFEPHPGVFDLLQENLSRWRRYRLAPITAFRRAIGSRPGAAVLHEHDDLGGSSLSDRPPTTEIASPPRPLEVECDTLDASLAEMAEIALVKIDVEGHEAAVLRGGSDLLASGRPRDLLFEDYHPQPSESTRLLESAGFTVFALHARWRGPALLPCGASPSNNYLATRLPERAHARFRRPGWKCLHLRARRRSAVTGR